MDYGTIILEGLIEKIQKYTPADFDRLIAKANSVVDSDDTFMTSNFSTQGRIEYTFSNVTHDPISYEKLPEGPTSMTPDALVKISLDCTGAGLSCEDGAYNATGILAA